jgi:type I restriction enzyme M protein
MVTERSKVKAFQEIFAECSGLHGRKGACLSFLFLDYVNVFPASVDQSLVKTATENCDQFLLPIKDRLNRKTLSDAIRKLDLKENDYFEISLSIIFDESKYDFDPSSGQYLSELVCRLLDVQATDAVFDLGSGFGGFLAMAAKFGKDRLFRPLLLGQEVNVGLASLSRMLLTMCEANFKIENINSLDLVGCPSYTKGYVFPPLALRLDPIVSRNFTCKEGKLDFSRASEEWMFVFRALDGLGKNGRLVTLLPESALFKSQDGPIRKYLLDNGLLEGIISLPVNSLSWAGAKTDLLVLSRGNKSFKILDAEPVLFGLPKKGLSSHEAAVDIYNAFNSPDVKTMENSNVESVDSNLSLSSLRCVDLYAGLSNPTLLTDVADVLRGCPLTLANFKDDLARTETDFRILTSSDIEDGVINYRKLAYLADGKKYSKYSVRKGDIVVTTKSTKVKMAVVNDEPEGMVIVTGGMLIVRPKTEKVDGTFLKMFFDSSKGREILTSVQKGVVINTISYRDFVRVKIPCPPISVQRDMADKYNQMLDDYSKAKSDLVDMENRLVDFYDDSVENN